MTEAMTGASGRVETGGGGDCVVAEAGIDWADTFPAASYAATVYEYAVVAARLVSEYEVPVVVVRRVLFLQIR